jgi:uncharacterized damage-inducible protein DinB
MTNSSTHVVHSIRAEYLRYKELAEKAIAQLGPTDVTAVPPGGGNSIATICWHVSGNLRSRFTEFLTSDGEKPWRKRDEEFESRDVSREELLAKWQQGWDALLDALAGLTDAHLHQQVSIRGQRLTVTEALVRSLAHTASHVGQIVYAAKMLRGAQWTYLSIPPGQSDTYNQNPALDKPPTR